MTEPPFTAPTRPEDDRSNAIATTQFVEDAVPGILPYIESDLEFYVGNQPGDYADFNVALADLTKRFPTNIFTISIILRAGRPFPTGGAGVANAELGHFILTAEDPVVTLAPGFQGFPTNDSGSDPVEEPFAVFFGDNCTFPVIDMVIDMNDLADNSGVVMVNYTRCRMTQGSEILDSGYRGATIIESSFACDECTISGSFYANLRVRVNSTVFYADGFFGGGARNGDPEDHCILISRDSHGYGNRAEVNGSFANGVGVHRSRNHLEDGQIEDATEWAVELQLNATASFSSTSMTGCLGDATVNVSRSVVGIQGIDCTGAANTPEVNVGLGGIVMAGTTITVANQFDFANVPLNNMNGTGLVLYQGDLFATAVPGSDLNNLTVSGWYRASTGVSNAPANNITVLHMQRTTDRASQLAITALTSPPRMWFRSQGSGAAWTAWFEVSNVAATSIAAAPNFIGQIAVVGGLIYIADGTAGVGNWVLQVEGPGTAVDNAAARWNGTDGALLQNSVLEIADTTGSLSRTGNGGIPIQGTNTNDSAAAGFYGELIESSVAAGSAVALTTATVANVTSISLTAGDWDVWGNVFWAPAGGSAPSELRGAINTVSATYPTPPAGGAAYLDTRTFTADGLQGHSVGRRRLSLSGTTTVYLVARATFGAGTCGAYGYIGARRAR